MAKYNHLRLAGESDLFETFNFRKKKHLALVTVFSIPLTSMLIAIFIILSQPVG